MLFVSFHLFINNILMMFTLQISDLPPAPPMHMQPHFQMQMMRFRGGPRGRYYANIPIHPSSSLITYYIYSLTFIKDRRHNVRKFLFSRFEQNVSPQVASCEVEGFPRDSGPGCRPQSQRTPSSRNTTRPQGEIFMKCTHCSIKQ